MLNQDQIKGKWREIKGGVRNLWGNLTDDEIESSRGNVYGLTGTIQKKYGETKEVIKSKLDRLMGSFENETDKGAGDESSYMRKPLDDASAGETRNFSIDTEDTSIEAENTGLDRSRVTHDKNASEDRIARH